LLAAIYSVLRQHLEGRRFVDNCYSEVAYASGNTTAQRCLDRVFTVTDAAWRGVGVIANSGFDLRPEYRLYDARERFPLPADASRRRAGQMPPGCDCAKVVLGKCYPNECRLYGRACTPRHPIGPCMVSDEGACRIWWAGGVRATATVTS
jgi:hydrogenase expression/formation protein HypD